MADGSWNPNFDPIKSTRPWAADFAEGNSWQYLWLVPQDVPGLIKLMGGKKAFLNRLDEFFTGGYYWHGNETDQQAPFMFAMAGNPSGTDEWINKIISEEYGTGPGGLSGNEDAGQMSAWLVFSMMGFYPVCPGSNQYVITTPVFDEVKVFLPDGKFFLISSINRENKNKYIRVITKNGAVFKNWFITHEEITKGGKFTLQLSPKPAMK